jgi:hypothetical protein
MSTIHHISFEELAGNLAAVLNKVREERTAVVVEYKTGENVVIRPIPTERKNSRRNRKRTKADYEAFRAAAGSWKDEDVDTFIQNVYESRRTSSRPPVEL